LLYGVETKAINRAVKRNLARFPEDFMFQLTGIEFENLRFHFGTSNWCGQHYMTYAFNENGVAMLSSVLNSARAIQVNIQIMRTFTRLREMLLPHKELQPKIDEIEKKYDAQFRMIFDAIRQLAAPPTKPRERLVSGGRTGKNESGE
jgi:hypothetical protein